MEYLKYLSLGSNQLRELPYDVVNLKAIERLGKFCCFFLLFLFVFLKFWLTAALDDNKIQEIPAGFSQNHSLSFLDLRNNDIVKVNEELHYSTVIYHDVPSKVREKEFFFFFFFFFLKDYG